MWHFHIILRFWRSLGGLTNMKFDLTDLQLFLNIVDAGSITAGAERSHLALASASERLRKMEQSLGIALLVRLPRGIEVTAAGAALTHHARLMLQQQHRLKAELSGFVQASKSHVCLYANSAALTEFLPSKLAAWLAENPHVRLKLKERTSADIVHAIAAGLADVGMVSNAVNSKGLSMHPLATDDLVVLVSQSHRCANQKKVSFEDILTEPFVGLSEGSALQKYIAQQAEMLGGKLDVRVHMNTFDGVGEMVAHGVGVGMVPWSAAKRYRRKYPYHSLSLTEDWAHRQLCACFRNWDELSIPIKSLLLGLGVDENGV